MVTTHVASEGVAGVRRSEGGGFCWAAGALILPGRIRFLRCYEPFMSKTAASVLQNWFWSRPTAGFGWCLWSAVLIGQQYTPGELAFREV